MLPLRIASLLLLFAVVANDAHSVQTTNILDLIYWDTAKPEGEGSAEIRHDGQDSAEDKDNEPQPKTCNCNGQSCLCCVDFNITYIDFGGPGCVNMRYVSQSEGVSVNVSYGESVLQSAQIRGGSNPEPACVSLLGSLAQVCAKFSTLETLDDGLKGCLLLEPKLLGDIQTQFSVGCFNMDQNGMRVDESNNFTNDIASPLTGTDVGNLTEEDILTAVKESAQQGLAFFENLFGLSFEATDRKDNGTEDGNNTNDNRPPPLQIKTSSEVKSSIAIADGSSIALQKNNFAQ